MGRLRASRSGESVDGAWSIGAGDQMAEGTREEGENISGGEIRRWRWERLGMRPIKEREGKEEKSRVG